MGIEQFRDTLILTTPPQTLSIALQALWYDAKGDWNTAHTRAQAQDDQTGAWVHAYLHRKEGDLSNAGYWYRKAGKPVADTTLAEEWEAIAITLLGSDNIDGAP
jgi:hypothetical protein